jgi:outer membrane protein assembly factor BamB
MIGPMTAVQRPFLILVILCGATATSAMAQTGPRDYPQWRGQTRDGSASGFQAPASWPDSLTPRWKVEVGAGYATPIVMGDRVFTHTRQDENEVMLAIDAETGKTIWRTSYQAPYRMNPATRNHGQGPKSTPLYADGRLYTLGISGIVSAFDAADGKLLWQKPAPPVDPMYGTAMSPAYDRGAVIFHMGGHDNGALTALDAATGNVRWSWSGDGPAYASPIVVELGGTRQVVTISQRNIIGVDSASGRLLWQRPWVSRSTNNSITPILYDGTLIVTGHDLGTARIKPVQSGGAWSVETVWETQEVGMFMSNPVLVGDTLYGLSHKASGQFFALDAKTGRVLWLGEPRAATNTAVVKAGRHLFLLNDDAELIVAEANPAGLKPERRYTVATSSTWAQPAISGNRVFVKDVSTLALWTLP